jgi:hypothetical protein
MLGVKADESSGCPAAEILVCDNAKSFLAKALGEDTEGESGIFEIETLGRDLTGPSVPGAGIVGCCGSGEEGASPGVG